MEEDRRLKLSQLMLWTAFVLIIERLLQPRQIFSAEPLVCRSGTAGHEWE